MKHKKTVRIGAEVFQIEAETLMDIVKATKHYAEMDRRTTQLAPSGIDGPIGRFDHRKTEGDYFELVHWSREHGRMRLRMSQYKPESPRPAPGVDLYIAADARWERYVKPTDPDAEGHTEVWDIDTTKWRVGEYKKKTRSWHFSD